MHIALISYYFNDHHSEGIVTAKLARALIESGHIVTVFGSKIGNSGVFNLSRNKKNIYSVSSKKTIYWKYFEEIIPNNFIGDKIIAFPRIYICNNLNGYSWVQNIVKLFIKTHKEEKFDLIHSRLYPHSSHQAVLKIRKKIPEIPWCAYFSDPWPPNQLPYPYKSKIGYFYSLRMDYDMSSYLKRPGSLIFPSKRLEGYTLKGKRSRFLSKSFSIPHLSPYWKISKKRNKEKKLVFRYTGIININRNTDSFFNGLRLFLLDQKKARNQIKIEFMGRNHAGFNGSALEPPEDLKDIVVFHKQTTLEIAWDWMLGADILLLLEADFQEGIFFPSKLSDYLHTQRPIFALSPSAGVVSDILKIGGGLRSSPEDSKQIADKINEFYFLWQKNNLISLKCIEKNWLQVLPNKIIPAYEEAFQLAIKNAI
jgi:hypothetical protein